MADNSAYINTFRGTNAFNDIAMENFGVVAEDDDSQSAAKQAYGWNKQQAFDNLGVANEAGWNQTEQSAAGALFSANLSLRNADILSTKE